MSAEAQIQSVTVLAWFSRHAGFPGSRLDARAEQLLLIGRLIEAENLPATSESGTLQIPGAPAGANENAQRAAMRTMSELRKRVHFKCDNGAKV
ncbi:hypothetical protein IMCC26134_11420 [Verrucomicrobia bacterium IMCC26134]|jgi:hypothetical protein|nr:hypothetical protein IMCC26134_11420 [Verrucomicrobia bacterium IMCC26134]